MKRLAIFSVVVFLTFIATTFVALEFSGVVVVRTVDATTSDPRETHVWYVREGGYLLLEAGSPKNPWVNDLASMHTLELRGAGLDGEYQFTFSEKTSHEDIRLLMRNKYGWRDWWVDFLFDTSQSAALEVTRVASSP